MLHRKLNLAKPKTAGILVVIVGAFLFVPQIVSARDDELSRKERRLISALVERGMPELIEEMIVGRPRILKIHVARAAARAANEEPDAAVRRELIRRSTDAYAIAIAAATDSAEKDGEPGRFLLARLQIELADLLLRRVVGPDLDQFEITSGLAFDRKHAIEALEQTAGLYTASGEILEDMDIRSRIDSDETYLLHGIAGKIGPLLERQRLNGAWCSIYRAMLSAPDAPERNNWTADARTAFDTVARSPTETSIKYNAQLGLGIALRESRRFDEANDFFSRVAQSTQPPGMTTRAMYEMSRSLIADGKFDAARRLLEQLAAESADDEAAFYVRLAPLVRAYTYIAESQQIAKDNPLHDALEKQAETEFVKLARQGGVWTDMVQIYLQQIAGAERDITELSTVELGLAAGRWMTDREFDRALRAWEVLLSRDPAPEERHLARFNQAVCLFQLNHLRDAAVIFLQEAKRPPDEVSAPKVYDYAYRVWKQIAADSGTAEDYLTLSEAAQLLNRRHPENPLADEAIWVAALSLEQAGRYESAIASYNAVPESSSNYWEACRNAARCRQRVYKAVPEGATIVEKQRMARLAIEEWQRLGERIDRAIVSLRETPGAGKGVPNLRTLKGWRQDARLAAASIYAGDDLRDFDACLELIEGLEPDARQLDLRVRCYQAKGRTSDVTKAIEAFIRSGVDEDVSGVLISVAANMQTEIEKLRRFGRRDESKKLAEQTIPIVQYLIRLLEQRPEHQQHVPIAQLALVDTMVYADQLDEARERLDELTTRHPDNGTFLRRAARLYDRLASLQSGSSAEILSDQAENLWGKLLSDGTLANHAPNVYWEARYNWLRHQLRHQRAADVVAGIESERAWQPTLGGPPWQGRLLELLAKAERMAESQRGTD